MEEIRNSLASARRKSVRVNVGLFFLLSISGEGLGPLLDLAEGPEPHPFLRGLWI